LIEILASGESCIGDFTFDFFWQHGGSRLDPSSEVGGHTYKEIVSHLRCKETVKVIGDVGGRLGSSMGADLVAFGGRGGACSVGSIIVDGNAGSRMGISMLSGSIYLSGNAADPLGNVLEVESDLTGYRKFVSITEVASGISSASVKGPNEKAEGRLAIKDGILRETICARCDAPCEIVVNGDVGMSAGILMKKGVLKIEGDAGKNTGVLLRGGTVIVEGRTEEFTAAEMRRGTIFVSGDAGSFLGARMTGGAVFALNGKPVPPVRSQIPSAEEQGMIQRVLRISQIESMMFKKYRL
jgi:formylmethanofuran dehydrogenase subunit C